MKSLLYYIYKHILYIDLPVLSIHSTEFISQFSMIAFCTCEVHDVIIDSIWNTQRKCLKENLNLNIFCKDDFKKTFKNRKFCRFSHDMPAKHLFGV